MNTLQASLTRLLRLENPIDKRLIWALVGLLALGGFVVFSGLNSDSSSATVAAKSSAGWAKPNSTFAKPKIYVHIVGEVRRAGLYRLASGSRIADAVFAAEGFTARADQASINLARVLTDGEQIVVYRAGGSAALTGSLSGGDAGTGSSSGIVSGSGTGSGSGTRRQALVNLNRGDEAAIESLPGVGPTLAGRIIDWRLANGGFKTKSDLQKVAGIGDKLFAKLKDLVTL